MPENMERICETCKYEDYGLFEEPCRSCIIETNSNWEPKGSSLETAGDSPMIVGKIMKEAAKKWGFE